jgi:hypothetical protein
VSNHKSEFLLFLVGVAVYASSPLWWCVGGFFFVFYGAIETVSHIKAGWRRGTKSQDIRLMKFKFRSQSWIRMNHESNEPWSIDSILIGLFSLT